MIKPADLFFTTSGSIFSRVVQKRTWGKFSHVQIIVQVVEAADKRIIDVISADAEGVTLRAVRDHELKNYEILTCPEMFPQERNDVVKFCFQQIGKPYDLVGLGSFLLYKEMQNDSKWFCSELVYVAYKQAGVRLLRRVKQDFVSPRDLYISPLLMPIEGRLP